MTYQNDQVTITNPFPIKPAYEAAEDKLSFLKQLVKSMGNPHYQSLKINIDSVESIQHETTLHTAELQTALMQYADQKAKMLITVNYLCNNRHEFTNNGGFISIGLNFKACDYAEKDQNGFPTKFENNPVADKNQIKFSALKGISVYEKYIFSDVRGDDILGVYDSIYYTLTDIRHVKTYTIVYIVNDSMIREVTLHDFGKYGNILTTVDLKI